MPMPCPGFRSAGEGPRRRRPRAAPAPAAAGQSRRWRDRRRRELLEPARLPARLNGGGAASPFTTSRRRTTMTTARALVGIGSLLVATMVPATLLGGCTTQGMGTSTVGMAQPAPRARTTPGAASYTPVTDQRLVSPEAENWLMYRRTYDGWGYSPLEQITTGNVKDLVPVWSFSTGVAEGHQAPPIVNNGIMFVSTPQNQVLALDAKTGALLWRYKPELPDDLFQLHPTNRGVGLYEDKVYLATLDAHVVALDAKTGKLLWDRTGGGLQEGLLHDAGAPGGQ